MGWGIGFDPKFKGMISGVASIYVDTLRMSAVLRNQLHAAVRTLYCRPNDVQTYTLIRNLRLTDKLPIVNDYAPVLRVLPQEIAYEAVAAFKLVGMKARLLSNGSWYVNADNNGADTLGFHNIVREYSLEYRVPELFAEQRAFREELLDAIANQRVFTVMRTF
jgi:hypothetical protein